jgi:hypothetical protein
MLSVYSAYIPSSLIRAAALACGLVLTSPASAVLVAFHGKVTLEDGSPPGHMVTHSGEHRQSCKPEQAGK